MRAACTALALLLAAAGAAATVVTNDAGSMEWSTAASYTPMMGHKVGDVIEFRYNAYHDVWKMADATAYAACDATGGTELATNEVGGGSGDLINVYEYTVTEEDLEAGTIYFACSYYPLGTWSHCFEGQALSVTLKDSVSAGARVSAPRVVALAAGLGAGLALFGLWA